MLVSLAELVKDLALRTDIMTTEAIETSSSNIGARFDANSSCALTKSLHDPRIVTAGGDDILTPSRYCDVLGFVESPCNQNATMPRIPARAVGLWV